MNRLRRSKMKLLPNLSALSYILRLNKHLKDCKTVLDIGCGELSPLSYLKIDQMTGVEKHVPSLKNAKKNQTHHVYISEDITNISRKFKKNQFDACVALDVIEHLPKKEGYRLIKDMEKIARKKIVLFTPNGFLNQPSNNNQYQEHLSGWTAQEMKDLGFQVTGVYGLKSLRGAKHELKYKPKIFWGLVSELTNIVYTSKHPAKAAAILCIKNLGKHDDITT